MSRSIKKGPFVAPELYKRVEELNKAGEKKVLLISFPPYLLFLRLTINLSVRFFALRVL